ncbi:hypothetical protein BGZ60DRAFT_363889 [Tricladium varicosporioides]|nr:hypothetical protein BGZ60DRAFT_363889 [Hymenoscyphus varicosporioides]
MRYATVRKGAHELANRSVHIKMYPTAQTFAERREVLRVLEQFGEVTMFRSLKYLPKNPVANAFLAIFDHPDVAATVINRSPIQYRLTKVVPPPSKPETSPSDSMGSSMTTSEEPALPVPEIEPSQKAFELHISSTNFNHAKHISSSPLYGPFQPITPKESYIAASLHNTIPPTIMAAGLRDWETDGNQVRDRRPTHEKLEDGEVRKTSILNMVEKRIMRRRKEEIPEIMRGLRGLKRGFGEKTEIVERQPEGHEEQQEVIKSPEIKKPLNCFYDASKLQ